MSSNRKNRKIVIVDYGVGNLYSLKKAVDKFCRNVIISDESEVISLSDAIILPGVGSFQAGINGLKIRNLTKTLKNFAKQNKPILGICLGAQLLLSKGYEFGTFNGLNIVPGKVTKFTKLKEKIPHIGWNGILPPFNNAWKKTILSSVKKNSDLYFVHSYILQPEKEGDILSLTKYGNRTFCSAIKRKNIYGCQFHPEKSGKVGLKIIENFVNLI